MEDPKFVPEGHRSFADVRDSMDLDEFRSALADGRLVATRLCSNGELLDLPKEYWWLVAAAETIESGRIKAPPDNTSKALLITPAYDPLLVRASGLPLSDIYETGLPGRPSSKHLIEQEFLRRQAAGETERTRSGEARSLADWLKATHPRAPRSTAKTIENHIRDLWNTRK